MDWHPITVFLGSMALIRINLLLKINMMNDCFYTTAQKISIHHLIMPYKPNVLCYKCIANYKNTQKPTSSLTCTCGSDSFCWKTAFFFSSPFSFSTLSFPLRALGALGFLSALGLGSLGLAARLVAGFWTVGSPFFILPLVFSSGSHSSGSSSLPGLSRLHSHCFCYVLFT